MIYYAPDRSILDSGQYSYLDKGSTAAIFKRDEEVFKVYFHETDDRNHMYKRTFKMLKELDIPNLVKLREYYCRFTGLIEKIKTMDGYTMDLVPGTPVKLIDSNKEYFEMILRQLEESLESLSENKIIMCDCHERNIMFTDNGVTLIDLDYYYQKKRKSKKEIYYLNKSKILFLFDLIMNQELKKEEVKGYARFYCTDNGSLTTDFDISYPIKKIDESMKKYILSQ